jgi:pimeloyl-ACP methyl ester carboxylesterase
MKNIFLSLLFTVFAFSISLAQTEVVKNDTAQINNLILPQNYKPSVYGEIPEYVKKGNGKQALILIPGLGLDESIFNDFMKSNVKDYTMYAITIPGYGKTMAPPIPATDSSYGLQYWNKGVMLGILKLIEKEKIINPIIAGYFTQGTQLALRLAIDYPEKIAGVITIGGPAKFILIQQGVPKEFPLKGTIAYTDKYTGPQWFKAMSHDDFNNGNYLPEIYSLNNKTGELLWKQVSNVPMPVIVRYLCEFFASDILLDLDKIKCPVLVLRPSFDSIVLNKVINNYVRPQFINAWDKAALKNPLITIKDIEGAASCSWKDKPDEVNKAIKQFIRNLKLK